jgi:hypothetical protein
MGAGRRNIAVGLFSEGFSRDSLDCHSLYCFLRPLPSFLQRENWLGDGIAQSLIFQSFRQAKVWQYGAVVALRAPLMIVGVLTYTLALRLFGLPASFGEILGYLPVIFFGAATPGPMHSVAILFWVILFPDKPGQMTAFGLVQHNFFIFFNPGIGLLFLRRASRELFS